MKPRIVHLIPEDGIGGVEVAARVMAAQPDLPCDFKLLFIAGSKAPRPEPRVFLSPFRSPRNPLAHLRALALCLWSDPDLLIVSLWKSVPVALLARLLRPRMRMVLFLHLERDVHFLDALLSRAGLRYAHEVWADSSATLLGRLGRIGKPTRVVSFVTDRLRRAKPAGPMPSPRFVSWSRLAHQKGIDRAVDFIAALSRRGVEAKFEVWGPDRGELRKLKRQVIELGIQDRVSFPGPASREQLPEIVRDASFFLQLSRTEGMAMSTVEAMQMGIVPLVTPVGEIPRYVADGENGILVDPDKPEAAVDRVVALLADVHEYHRLRQNAVNAWEQTPLYAEDVCAAAAAMCEGYST